MTQHDNPADTNAPRLTFLCHTCDEFLARARAIGIAAPRALAAYRRAFRAGECDETWAALDVPRVARSLVEEDTIKFTLGVAGGFETESVAIPMLHRQRATTYSLCVSSQIGCAMGCTFCETAQMGFLRNLTAAEIVAQWHASTHQLARRPSHIVFMGMGEPTDNMDAVIHAIRILTDQNGAGVGPKCIMVSTVGRPAGIRQLAALAREPGFSRLHLAVSINAPNDAIRSRIMPINRVTPLAELCDALAEWPSRSTRVWCAEYVLIPGVNDALEHADELCALLLPLHCMLNVIPYNPRRSSPWPAPSEEQVTRFVERCAARGMYVKRRITRGRDVMAACGQLGNAELRRRARAPEPATIAQSCGALPAV